MEKNVLNEYKMIDEFLTKHDEITCEELVKISKAVIYAVRLNGLTIDRHNIQSMSTHSLRDMCRKLDISLFQEMNKEELKKTILTRYNEIFQIEDVSKDVFLQLPPMIIGTPVEADTMDAHDICRYESKYVIDQNDAGNSFMRFLKHVFMYFFYKVYRNVRYFNHTWFVFKEDTWQIIPGIEEVMDEYFNITENSCLSFDHLDMFNKTKLSNQKRFLKDFSTFVKKQSNMTYVSVFSEPS
jgi:hypothetical protein